jgi:ABC-type glycerol-3-phosphate transport system substrate-binding protein
MGRDNQSYDRIDSNRRKFLSGLASSTAAGLAGCSSNGGGSDGNDGGSDGNGGGSDGNGGGSGGTTTDTASGTVEISIITTATETKEVYQEAFRQYNESRSDLNVKFSPQFLGGGSFTQKLNTLIGTGNPPDLAYAGAQLASFTDSFIDLTDLLERHNVPESLRLSFSDVGSPIQPVVLQAGHRYYRQDVWNEAGIDFPESEKAKTWSTHRDHMKMVSDALPKNRWPSFYLAGSVSSSMQFMWYGYEVMSGVNYIRRTGPNLEDVEVSLEDEREGALQYLKFGKEMFDNYSPDTTGYSWQEFIQLFTNETVQQSLYGGRLMTNVIAQAPELEDVTKASWIEMPEKNPAPSNHLVSSGKLSFPEDQASSVALNGFAIPKNAKHPKVAKDFINWFLDSDLYTDFMLSVAPHNLPVDMSLLDSEPFKENPAWSQHPEYKDFIKRYVKNSYPKVMGRTDPASPYWSQITYASGIVPKMQQQVFLGQKSPEKAIDEAISNLEQKTDEIVDRYTSE